jgi:hypothetical protein
MANILELIQKNDMIKVALILLGVYIFFNYMKVGTKRAERMQNYYGIMPEQLENVQGENQGEEKPLAKPEQPEEQSLVQDNAEQQQIDKIVAGADQVKADDLLPKYDAENEFAKENPVSKLLKEQNFLISGYHVGINTVMQSNKIPYHDIRSLPPIPKENAGPWNQSSYEQSPAQMRRFFEIGV